MQGTSQRLTLVQKGSVGKDKQDHERCDIIRQSNRRVQDGRGWVMKHSSEFTQANTLSPDVMMYVVGNSGENEVMLFSVVLALRDSLAILLK